MHSDTAAPFLLFITPLASLILVVLQLISLHNIRWNTHGAQVTRRLLALSVTFWIISLSALSGTLGLVAIHAWDAGDYSRASHADTGAKIIVVVLQFGLSVYMMIILNRKALVEPIPSSRIGSLTLSNVRGLTAVMSFPLITNTVISVIFAALQENYPLARLPALCWLLFFIPLFCVTLLLYVSIRRTKEHSIIACMWLVLAVGQACGAISSVGALVGKGDFQTPTSLFDALWITCATFALHIHSMLPGPNLNTLLCERAPFGRAGSPRALTQPPRPSTVGSFRPLQPAPTASREDFRTLQDPFASPTSPLTEKPFPLFEAVRVEKARKKSLSLILTSTHHSSPGGLKLTQKQSFMDDTPPPSPPANALVRAPRLALASYSGAFGA